MIFSVILLWKYILLLDCQLSLYIIFTLMLWKLYVILSCVHFLIVWLYFAIGHCQVKIVSWVVTAVELAAFKCLQMPPLPTLKSVFENSQSVMIRKLFSSYITTPSRSALRKRCSKNMQQIYSRTPMPKSDATLLKSHIGMGVSCKFSVYFQNTFS